MTIGRLAVVAIALIIVGCSSTTPSASDATAAATPSPSVAGAIATIVPPTAVPTTTPLPTEAPLAGIVVTGHSGLTGEGTGALYEDVPANSWATGTNPDVDSVYSRMVAVHPETSGLVANTAHGGAVAAELPDRVTAALSTVSRPALAIISTIDNDIRCDGTDPAHIPEFGASVAKALEVISTTSPDTRILIVGQAGRPSIPFIEELLKHEPSLASSMTGTGMCDFLDGDGKPVEEHFKTLASIIDAYEAEEARVCAAVPNCTTDGGVRAAYVDKIENFAPDWAHLNVRGQAAEAELIWPVVLKTLGW